jgi:hypothetical protein
LNWIIVNIHYVKEFDFHFLYFLKQITRLLPSLVTAYGVGRFLNYIPGYAWGTFMMKCALFLCVYAISVWLLGANESEKALILRFRRFLIPVIKKLQKAFI